MNKSNQEKYQLSSQVITNMPVNYQLVDGDKIYQNEYCLAMVFNKDSTIMVAGQNSKIKVYDLKLGKLQLTQVLSQHEDKVITLYFMKQSNEFISGSRDNTIIIWGINNNQEQYSKQFLIAKHSDWVNCVIMNRDEDLMISCSDDRTIKFWMKQCKWKCSQTLTHNSCKINSISLNVSQNQLASCGDVEQIMIFQQQSNNKWGKIQAIQVPITGGRLCFIGDSLIALQSYLESIIQIFEFNPLTKLFHHVQQIKVGTSNNSSCLRLFCPLVFNKQKQILLSKCGQALYLMRRQLNADFEVEQTFKYGTQCVYGTITDDGTYLVTWDEKSTTYKVRKGT